MKINNILIITVLFMSITITVCGIYFYPLYNPSLYIWAFLSVITSICNHFTPSDHIFKKIFQHLDRIVIRVSGLNYLLMTKKLNKDELLKIEKYEKVIATDIIVYIFIALGTLLYITSRTAKIKKPHIPINIIKLPHAVSHVLATIATIILFYEYSL
jgi:hypothetical protein